MLQPHVYAAVIDRRGVTVYRDPVWPGLQANSAALILEDAFPETPDHLGAPCHAGTGSCAANTPACLTRHQAPDGQPSCNASATPPSKMEGFESCPSPTTPSLTTTLAPPPPPPSLLTCCIATERRLAATVPGGGGGQETTRMVSRSLRTPQQLNFSCMKPPVAGTLDGKVCHDPLCDAASTSPTSCERANDTRGGRCVWDPAAGCENSSLYSCCGSYPIPAEKCIYECEGAPPPPPPPPAEKVYCCNCSRTDCAQSRRNKDAKYCTDSNAKCIEVPAGHNCSAYGECACCSIIS